MDTGKFDELMGEVSTRFGTTSFDHITDRQDGSVLVTFDDGYEDHAEQALPILAKYQINGLFFLLPEMINGNNLWDRRAKVILRHLTDGQVGELVAEGQTLGSHGLTHQNVVKLGSSALRHELEGSKQLLEDRYQVQVSGYAYPYGDFNDEAAEITGAIYPYAFATDNGTPNLGPPPNTAIKRLSIRGNHEIPTILGAIERYGS